MKTALRVLSKYLNKLYQFFKPAISLQERCKLMDNMKLIQHKLNG